MCPIRPGVATPRYMSVAGSWLRSAYRKMESHEKAGPKLLSALEVAGGRQSGSSGPSQSPQAKRRRVEKSSAGSSEVSIKVTYHYTQELVRTRRIADGVSAQRSP